MVAACPHGREEQQLADLEEVSSDRYVDAGVDYRTKIIVCDVLR